MKKYIILLPLLLLFLMPSNVFASSVSTYGVDYCATTNISTTCNTGTNGRFGYDYNNNRVTHFSFVTFNTNHDINVSAGDIVTLSALVYVTNSNINNMTSVYDNGPQLYGASTDDFNVVSIEAVDMTQTLFTSYSNNLDYYDINYNHLYIIRVQANKSITREYWRFRWDFDIGYSTVASGGVYFRVNVSTGAPSNDYLILQAIQSISTNQNQTTNAINNVNNSITSSSTNGNGIDSATGTIQNLIPTDSKTEGYYNNVFSFFNRVKDSVNTSCSAYSMQLMEQTINFPCIDMASIFGDWWGVIDMLCCIWPIINIFNLFIGWVDAITDLEDMSYFSQAKHVHWSREDYRKGMYY